MPIRARQRLGAVGRLSWQIAIAAPTIGARTIALGLAAAAPLLVGCADDASNRTPSAGAIAPRSAVTSVAHQLAGAGADSAVVALSEHGHDRVATAGSPRPVVGQRFRVGSVTKVFTATIILQLRDERRLRLDDTLEQLLPGAVAAGARITIRDLLGHRSGLANYTDDPSWLRRERRLTHPVQSLRLAAAQPLEFAPGTQWRYSNTNYVALGLIIEKLTGHTYAHELRQRIFRPLGLRHTQLATTPRVPDLHDDGVNPHGPWAAGSIVSNAHDVARFVSALLSGRILSRASLAQMKRSVPAQPGGIRNGLGIFASATRCGTAWGHNGQILDYATWVAATPDGARVAVLSARPETSLLPSDVENHISTLLCDNDAARR